MNKKKIIGLAGAVVVCILVFVFIVIRGKSPNPAENPEEMLGRIEKRVEDQMTKTKIRQLDGEESVQELGRILGGAKITDAVLENAREMKILASGLKK